MSVRLINLRDSPFSGQPACVSTGTKQIKITSMVSPKKISSKCQKLETMIVDQKRHLDLQIAEHQAAQKRGEAIYLHYQQVVVLYLIIQ